jgi:hypothetical protein
MRQLTRVEQGWQLPIEGMTVTQIAVDYAVTIALDAQFAVRIGMPFKQFGPDSTIQSLDPEADPSLLAPALKLLRTKAVSGFAFDDGRLELTFEEDLRVSVPSSDEFEPWELSGPDGLLIVSVPGGKISIWKS